MKTSTKTLTLLVAALGLSSLARAAAPSVTSASALSVSLGEATVLSAAVSDADADLKQVVFAVKLQDSSDWTNVGTVKLSGSASKAELVCTINLTGIHQVRATASDNASNEALLDSSFEVFTGKLLIAPVTIGNGVARMHEFGGEILTTANATTSTTVVQSGGNFILWSGGRVTLKPGFKVEAGSFFWAAVDHNMNGYSDLEEVTDTDGDGIPDAWEVDHGLSMTQSNTGWDTDGDGLSDLQEYQQGRDPHKKDNPSIAFAVFTPTS